MAAEKTAIARRAMAEIPDGATIFLDSSTTTLAMLPFLEREPARGLTLVTSSPSIAAQLVAPHIHTIVVPGELNQSLRALTGRWTIEFLERLSFGVAFVSSAGITAEGGLSTTQRELAEVTRAAFAQAGRRIALVDSTKFGVSALLTIDSPIDLVITDNHLAGHTISEFGAAGVRIVQAGDEE
jgi:DeoR family fructose operon transcriptional repressor